MSEQPVEEAPAGEAEAPRAGGILPLPTDNSSVVVYRWPGEDDDSFRTRVAAEMDRQAEQVWRNQRLTRKFWGYDDVEESQPEAPAEG